MGRSLEDLQKRALTAATALVALILPGTVLADDPLARGIDSISFKLAPGDSFGTVDCARAMPPGQYRFDLAADSGFGLLSLVSGDEKVGNLLESRLDIHLLLALGLPGRIEVFADLPVTLHQGHGFELLTERGLDILAPSSRGMGDIRLGGKIALLSPGDDAGAATSRDRHEHPNPWSAALVAEVRLPTGDGESFLGERGLMLAPRAVVGWEVGGLRTAATLGYRFRTQPGRFLNLHVGDEIHAGLAAAQALPAFSFLAGWDVFGELTASTPAAAPFAIGSPAYKTPLELLLGLRFALPAGLEARLMGGTGLALESGFGRPGLRLATTIGYAWPTRPSVRLPARATPREQPARPVDGRLLARRAPCKPVPCEPVACEPVACEPVPCEPQEPPEPVVDTQKGPPYAVVDRDTIQLREQIHFDLGQATVQSSSLPVLDDVISVLEEHPEILRIRIDGHTDSSGSADFNMGLSQRRAQAVVDYLVSKGIEAGRLSARGFGQTQPIDTNETPAGRARNRRVEVTILERE